MIHTYTHTHTGCYQKTSFVFANASIDFVFFFFFYFSLQRNWNVRIYIFRKQSYNYSWKDRFRSRNSSSLVRGNEYHFIESDDSIFYFNSILHEISILRVFCEYVMRYNFNNSNILFLNVGIFFFFNLYPRWKKMFPREIVQRIEDWLEKRNNNNSYYGHTDLIKIRLDECSLVR